MTDTMNRLQEEEALAKEAGLPTRRFVLQTLGAAGLTATVLAVGGKARSATAIKAQKAELKTGDVLPTLEKEYDWAEHLYSYLVDTRKCIGCGMCARACKIENEVPQGYYRTWVERYVVSSNLTGSDSGHAKIDSPMGGVAGFKPEEEIFHSKKAFFVPKLCNHCANTPCVQVCPVGASYYTPEGVVMVDKTRCIGCSYCVQACPYASRFIDPESHTANKCTWCYHRITKGEDIKPACVQACPKGARLFGDLKRRDDPVRALIASERIAVLKPELLTKPKCYYIGLDRAVR